MDEATETLSICLHGKRVLQFFLNIKNKLLMKGNFMKVYFDDYDFEGELRLIQGYLPKTKVCV